MSKIRNLVRSKVANGPLDSAIPLGETRSLERALSLLRDQAHAWFRQGDLARAADCCRQALELRDSACARCDLGTILRLQGKPEEAVAELSCAVKLDPHFTMAWSGLGDVLIELGRLPEAEPCFRQAIDLEPGNEKSYLNLG